MKKIISCVTNDLVSDQRVHKAATSLLKEGNKLTLVGRVLKKSEPLKRDYNIKRFNLPFQTGALFYASYNIRLFIYLLFNKYDIVIANDLDTLLAATIASKIKGKKIVYDSHEFFTEVPEIQDRKIVKVVWSYIERICIYKADLRYTVNDSIAKLFKSKYNLEFGVIRNIGPRKIITETAKKENYGIAENKKIIILQGAGINVDRGAEEAVLAMKYINNAVFMIVGKGDIVPLLKNMVKKENLSDKVIFIDRLPYQELLGLTSLADIGLSLDKDTNINYRFSLPNKIFDYIQCNTAIVASNIVEVRKIVEKYNVGRITKNHNPKEIAETINSVLNSSELLNELKENTKEAAKTLCWENEEKILLNLYSNLLN